MRYEITIDRDLLEHTPKGAHCTPLMLLNTETGVVTRAHKIALTNSKVVYGPPRQNGARVWVEGDTVEYIV